MSELKILEGLKVHGDLKATGAIYDSNDSPGTSGQLLQSTATGTDWVDATGISAGDAEAVRIAVKNTSGATITKGTPVYITGNVGNSDRLEVAPADASDASKMPAVGLLESDLANNAEGYVAQGGYLKGLSTATIDGTSTSSNDTVYVKSGGGLTMTKPTGTNYIQNVAKVARVHASSGSLVVSSILRTNDVPTPLYIDHTNQRLGIGATSPAARLHVITNDDVLSIFKSTDNKATIQLSDNDTDAFVSVENNRIALGPNTGTHADNLNYDLTNKRLGVGTTSPSAKLTVKDGNSAFAFQEYSSGATIFLDGSDGDFTGGDYFNISAYGTTDLAFGYAASTKITMKSDGRLGIGTTSPAVKLHVEGSGSQIASTGFYYNTKIADNENAGLLLGHNNTANGAGMIAGINEIAFLTYSGGWGERMRLSAAGSLGVGTASPSHKVDIYSNSNVPLRIHRPSNANLNSSGAWGIGFSTRNDAATSTTDTRAGVFSYYNGGLFLATGSSSIISDPDSFARLTVLNSGSVGIGTMTPARELEVTGGGNVYLRITASTDNDSSAIELKNTQETWELRNEDTNDDALSFNSDTSGNVMTLLKGGNVGIGTGSPTSRLTVYDSAGQATTLSNSVDRSAIYINADSANGSNNLRIGESGSGAYFLQVSNSAGTTPYAIHLNPFGGNVGVGTNNPTNKLEVAGTIYSHTNIIASATIGNKGTNKGINFENPQEGVQTARIDSDRLRFYFGGSGGTGETVTFNENGTIGVNTTSPHAGTRMQICGSDTTPSLNTTAIDDTSLVISNSDDDYGMVFATDGSGKGYIQQRRTASATYYDLLLQPHGGSVGIGTTSTSSKLHIKGSGTAHRTLEIEDTTPAIYFNETDGTEGYHLSLNGSAMYFLRDTDGDKNYNSIDGYISGGNWFMNNSLYVGSSIRHKDDTDNYLIFGTDTQSFFTSGSNRLHITSAGNIGIGATSPGAKLDVQPASNGKITKFGNDVMTQYTMTGLSNHTLTLTCGSYYQAEVIITANQTNGGDYNNLYIRGIWHNNHESHHWEEIEHIGELGGSSFTITVSQNTTSNSGKLVIQHNYSSASFAQAVIRVTDFYNTHSYTLT